MSNYILYSKKKLFGKKKKTQVNPITKDIVMYKSNIVLDVISSK